MIKLTNAVEAHLGNSIYINPDYIVAIYTVPVSEGGSLSTVVYGGTTGVEWRVEESEEQVINLIKKFKESSSCGCN